jgi:F0F1-type ATP synthase membrane subunit c/vacuolar-type H+-ATPase subunit K
MVAVPAVRERQQRQLQNVWSAMLLAVVLYGVVGTLVLNVTGATTVPGAETVRTLMSVAAIVVGLLSVWWRRRFLADETAVSAASLPFVRLQTHALIVWALADAVGVFGLAVAVLARDGWEFVPFGAAAIALFVLHRPAKLPWDRVAVSEA